jgi:hypothetical protein
MMACDTGERYGDQNGAGIFNVKCPARWALKLALKPLKNSMKVFEFFTAAVTKPDENYWDQQH